MDSKGTLYVLRSEVFGAQFVPSEYPITPTTTYTETIEQVDPNASASVAADPATNRVFFAEEGSAAKVAIYEEVARSSRPLVGLENPAN